LAELAEQAKHLKACPALLDDPPVLSLVTVLLAETYGEICLRVI